MGRPPTGLTALTPGQRFGRLVAHSPHRALTRIMWLCACDCGGSALVTPWNLLHGETLSCGCLRREKTAVSGMANKTHGKTGSRTYTIWRQMTERCRNVNHISYSYYGARGISVCERWASFENFIADMGVAPAWASIDRIDNNGNYCPENCRWATAKQQAHNRRTSVLIAAFGETKSAAEWADDPRCLVRKHTILVRVRKGWAAHDALLIPSNKPRGGRRATA